MLLIFFLSWPIVRKTFDISTQNTNTIWWGNDMERRAIVCMFLSGLAWEPELWWVWWGHIKAQPSPSGRLSWSGPVKRSVEGIGGQSPLLEQDRSSESRKVLRMGLRQANSRSSSLFDSLW